MFINHTFFTSSINYSSAKIFLKSFSIETLDNSYNSYQYNNLFYHFFMSMKFFFVRKLISILDNALSTTNIKIYINDYHKNNDIYICDKNN